MTLHNGRFAAWTNCRLVHSVCCQWQLGVGIKSATGLHRYLLWSGYILSRSHHALAKVLTISWHFYAFYLSPCAVFPTSSPSLFCPSFVQYVYMHPHVALDSLTLYLYIASFISSLLFHLHYTHSSPPFPSFLAIMWSHYSNHRVVIPSKSYTRSHTSTPLTCCATLSSVTLHTIYLHSFIMHHTPTIHMHPCLQPLLRLRSTAANHQHDESSYTNINYPPHRTVTK